MAQGVLNHSVAVKDFEAQVDKLLQQITIPENLSKWAIKWLQKEHAQEVTDRTSIKDNLQAVDKDVQSKVDVLLDKLLSGLISDAEYQEKKDSLLLEQQNVRRRLQETDTRADNWLELSEKTFVFATYARHWFAHGDNQKKREILSALGSNLMLKDKKLLIYQHKPFRILNSMQEKIEVLLDVFEPEELLDIKAQSKPLHPVIQSWLPDLDSNQDKRIQSPLSYH